MSSSSVVICVLLLLVLVSVSLANPPPRGLFGPSRLNARNQVSSAVPGVTIQLFTEPTCKMNISTQESMAGTLSPNCQKDSTGLFSMILNCQIDSNGVTTFDYGIWQNDMCSGASLQSINSVGKGTCIPTTISQNGQKVPIPLYATVTCSAPGQTQQTPIPSLIHFNPPQSSQSPAGHGIHGMGGHGMK